MLMLHANYICIKSLEYHKTKAKISFRPQSKYVTDIRYNQHITDSL